MKHINKITSTLQGFTDTIIRFPITILFFFLSAVLTSYYISIKDFNENYLELLLSFAVGAGIYMVLQLIYERFFTAKSIRIIYCGLAVFGAIIYYLIIKFAANELGPEEAGRTIVFLFILLIVFIWVPSVKSKIGFSDSFMAVFKGFFTVAFYSGVMFLGIALILLAFDSLIADVDSRAYRHVLNVIAFLYAPLHFLALIPVYPAFNNNRSDYTEGNDEENRIKVIKAIEPSKFLEALITYIIIPVTVVFTLILLLYILLNITGDFWKDNLMEPLLVSYSITVIIVYLLATVLKNKIAAYFRMIFPKVLIPVVLFQTISSVLKIGELGITYGRYYVIMFGIFATVSAFIFSFRPNCKANPIAPILIVLSLISILPFTDAFSVSRKNQINRLTNVLEENNMLKDGNIIPKADIPKEDRQIIIKSIQYLDQFNYTQDINWLKPYTLSHNFEKTFGFAEYDVITEEPLIYRLYLPKGIPMAVSNYDYIIEAEFYGQEQSNSYEAAFGENNEYKLVQQKTDGTGELLLTDSSYNELVRFHLDDIYDRFTDRYETMGEISLEEASFITESEKVILCVIAKSVNKEVWENGSYHYIEALVMIKIK